MSLHGHYWTLVPHLRKVFRPPAPPVSRHFSTWVDDPVAGPVPLTGRLSEVPGATTLMVLVHGLGGWSQSKYTFAMARAAVDAGLSCLRINLRGADRLGRDFYHAGQSEDLAAILRAPALGHYAEVFVVGYSIGGHVVLRYVQGPTDPRVRAACSLCAPLDLDASATVIDHPSRTGYRRYVLGGLKQMYEALSQNRRVPTPVNRALRIDRMREWDDIIVSPRYGFDGAAHYYRMASAGPRMSNVNVPTLVLSTEEDPMVLGHTIRPSLLRASHQVEARWLPHGGHVGFPPDVDLDEPAPRGVEPQVLSWLMRHRQGRFATT